jgi:ABC-type multidrug transport system ATPase subunit
MNDPNNRLILNRVAVRREHDFTLGPIDLTFEGGRAYAFIGENGSGKSTLLSCIYGELPSAGTINWNDSDVKQLAPFELPFTYVRQDFPLLEMYSVRETLLLSHAFAVAKERGGSLTSPWNYFKEVSSECQQRAEHIATTIGVSALLNRRLTGLSGGQKQRVAIAASLAAKGKCVLFLDEPTSALGSIETQKLSAALQFRLGEADAPIVIFATHDLDFVEQIKPVKVTFHKDTDDSGSDEPRAYIVTQHEKI